jgi:sulfite exporter TauE/SafE
VTSYALLGAAMGLAGSTILFGDQGRPVEGVLSLVIAVVMLLLGLGMLGVIPAERIIERLPWQNRVTCALREALAAPNLPRSYAMGFANGWLPCGPVLMAAATAAATGSVWKGALAMVYFGLGTIPVLVLLMLGVGRIRAAARVHLNRISAALVIVVAIQLGLRGLAAWGVVPHLAWGEVVFW